MRASSHAEGQSFEMMFNGSTGYKIRNVFILESRSAKKRTIAGYLGLCYRDESPIATMMNIDYFLENLASF